MRPIIYTFMAIVTVMLLNAQAFATMATWADGDGWNIQGNSEVGYCLLSAYYEPDDMLTIAAGNLEGGPAMGLSNRNLRALTQNAEAVEANLRFSNGGFYRIVGRVLSPTVILADIPIEAVLDFAKAASMEVRVRSVLIGAYNLAGTNTMVVQLAACIEAMGGEPS